jgi:Protein kinase domain
MVATASATASASASASASARTHRTLGNYRLGMVLGVGGMSTVYAAEDATKPGQRLAIKVLRLPEGASQATFVARFRREAQTATALRHERILPVLDCGEQDGAPYMVLPLMSSGTLAARLAEQPGPLLLAAAARYAREVAAAVDFAHAHGVVHRDVKPSNVLLDEHDGAYLADFGIAHIYDLAAETPDWTQLTTAGEVMGTPSYMAPEQFLGVGVGPAADIYALGVMLYLLVTSRLPFLGETPLAIGLRHLYEEPVAPRLLRTELPAPANAAILRALRKEPGERFASSGALADAFAQGLDARWTAENPRGGAWVGRGECTAVPAPDRAATSARAIRGGHEWLTPTPGVSWNARLPGRERAGGNRRVAGVVAAVLLFLFALALAAHGPAGRTATSAAPMAMRFPTATATPVYTATPAHRMVAVVTASYAGSRIFGRTADGTVVWTYQVDGKDGRIVAVSGIEHDVMYVRTETNIVYALRASDGAVLSRLQPAQGGGGDGGNGGNGGDGGDGGGDGGD